MPTRAGDGFQESTAAVRLIAGADRIGLCGRFPAVTWHHHAALAVVVGIDGPIRIVAGRARGPGRPEARALETRAALVAPGIEHALDLRGGRLATFVLPPRAIPRWGKEDTPVRDLGRPREWAAIGEAVFRSELSSFDPIDAALRRERCGVGGPLDDRLAAGLDLLAASLADNLPIEALAAEARLSPSRLMSLAQDQLGAPLRRYRRWLRAFRVARDYARGASLTRAALDAGFSSSADLAATARDHFGIRPSDILRPDNRPRIRVV